MEHIDLTELLDVEESYSAIPPIPGLLCAGLACGGGVIGVACGAMCGGGACGGACVGLGCGGVC